MFSAVGPGNKVSLNTVSILPTSQAQRPHRKEVLSVQTKVNKYYLVCEGVNTDRLFHMNIDMHANSFQKDHRQIFLDKLIELGSYLFIFNLYQMNFNILLGEFFFLSQTS